MFRSPFPRFIASSISSSSVTKATTCKQSDGQNNYNDTNVLYYQLNRVDTYGNKYVISKHANKEEAEAEFKKLMEVPHKQGYDIEEVKQ